ncbi:membrane hypothetical protein [Candidatus Zixiibacteriota bacterium]|nr:membrane hypothetical protein [candidate division Zixibacteria bacterium]
MQIEKNIFKHGNKAWAGWIFYGTAILAIIIFFFQNNHYAHREIGNDFTCYLQSANLILHDHNPYDAAMAFRYIYPLFPAFLLIPLTFLPYAVANVLWFILNVIALIVVVKLVFADGDNPLFIRKTTYPVPLEIVALLLMIPIIQNNLNNGQINFIVLSLCLLFFHYSQKGKSILSSVFLGMAIAIKLVPLILICYLVLRKDYRSIFLSTLFGAIFCLMPMIIVGNRIFGWYCGYFQSFIASGLVNGIYSNAMYFTFSSFIDKVLPALRNTPLPKLLGAGLLAILIATLEWMAIRIIRKSKDSNLRLRRDINIWIFSAYLLGILLISPSSQTHHLAFLIPSWLLIFMQIVTKESANKRTLILLSVLFLVCFYLGGIFKGSPFYFFSILLLYLAELSFLRTKEIAIPNTGIN